MYTLHMFIQIAFISGYFSTVMAAVCFTCREKRMCLIHITFILCKQKNKCTDIILIHYVINRYKLSVIWVVT